MKASDKDHDKDHDKETLDQLIGLVRQTYFMQLHMFNVRMQTNREVPDPDRKYAHLDGGKDTRGVKHNPIWPKIVKLGLEINADPCEIVRAVFAAAQGNKPPLHTTFASKSAAAAYRQYGRFCAEEVEYAFRAFQKAAMVEHWRLEQIHPVADEQIWRMVILSPSLQAGPLFRFCLAMNLKQMDLATSCRHSALWDFLKYPKEYEEALGKYLPPDFIASAKQLRTRIMQGL